MRWLSLHGLWLVSRVLYPLAGIKIIVHLAQQLLTTALLASGVVRRSSLPGAASLAKSEFHYLHKLRPL